MKRPYDVKALLVESTELPYLDSKKYWPQQGVRPICTTDEYNGQGASVPVHSVLRILASLLIEK